MFQLGDKIFEHLQRQLESDEALSAATLMIHTFITRQYKRVACVQKLAEYLDNIIHNDVNDKKWRKLRVQNDVMQVGVLFDL